MNKFTAIAFASMVASVLAGAPAMAETYKLDASHTAITFHIDHGGFSTPSGKFMDVEGTLELDEKNPAAAKLNVTIPIAKLNTGVAKLDEHLLKEDFFDVEKFPTATFTSDKVDVTGPDTAKVSGMLKLHGVEKPVTLNVKLNKIGENMKKQKTAGFTADTVIKRSDFGMMTYLPTLGDDIKIEIESEANLEAVSK